MQGNLLDGEHRMKVYEAWPARNRFAFSGYWICGPADDLSAQICVIGLISMGMLAYYGFVMRYLLDGYLILFPIMTTASIVLMCVAYVTVHVTDPGIIPRRAFLEDQVVVKRKGVDLAYLLDKTPEPAFDNDRDAEDGAKYGEVSVEDFAYDLDRTVKVLSVL